MLDEHSLMNKVLKLAAKGGRFVSPNPMVGAIIVKNNKIIGSGFHKKSGSQHAEIEAMNKAKDLAGSTLYVNLEPCCIWGKTPPCVDKIIASGIKKVVISTIDPIPRLMAGR